MQNQILTVIFNLHPRLTGGLAIELSYCKKIPVYLQNNIININVTWNRKSNIRLKFTNAVKCNSLSSF